ncbi:MAG: FAD-dependent thymidylate synthase [Spirochaetes bacterium]|nr:FAD-dependent thymidylate synthase [Spirochaetota bacterium]MBN2770793.1 FAD-dependent thymidylate synthase [Spirochaetota bacterium]
MNKVQIQVQLLSITPDCEKLIEEAGRTCYLSFDKTGSNTSFISNAIRRGHLSIIEHACASFRIKGASRAFTHQLVRHRVASFSQQSQRYVDENNFNYTIPPSIEANAQALKLYNSFMEQARDVYTNLRSMNILKEDARFVLPNALESEIVFTANFRELRHLFDLRLKKSAQWEIRMVALQMLQIVKNIAPQVFGDYIIDSENMTAVSENS